MIAISTPDSSVLAAAIATHVQSKPNATWTRNADGTYNHTGQGFDNQCAISVQTSGSNELRCSCVWPRNSARADNDYGAYIGRFIEMIVSNFNDQVKSITVTLPSDRQ